jgi:peptidoglycan/xylan/chitin deacetylase (PgdA/CDA1 family)
LDLLKTYKAQATFFCIGKNVVAHPSIYQAILNEKQAVGNHSYNHMKGWEVDNKTYFEDVALASRIIDSELFRPPYGKIKFKQAKELSKHYKLVFWDVLTYDFDERTTSDKMVKWVKKYTRNGSIITFHDSLKAWPRLEKALPEILYFLKQEGYAMEALK